MNLLRNCSLALLSVLAFWPGQAGAQGTAFTYQGRLNVGGSPATGIYDLRFTVFNALAAGAAVGGPLLRSPVPITNGLFTVTLDFGAGIFTGPARWLEIEVRTNGAALFSTLSPRTELTPSPYAIFAGTAATVPNNAIGSAQLAANAVQSSDILDGTITSADIADGTIAFADLSAAALTSLDGRYVLKTGDTMTGALRTPTLFAPDIVASRITNTAGILSLRSATDIELMIDNGGGAVAAFEIFNGAGSHLFLVSETANARVFNNLFVDGLFGVGTTVLDANAVAQFNLPSSVSVPHVRIKSPLSNAGFGLQFVNPAERWFVGPNIGNWSDGRFCILGDSSNKGLIIAANGNVAIDSVSAASPFATLTIDGTIGFPTVATPMMYVYPSGTDNAQKPVIVHSPAYPGYGLFYEDAGDRFVMQSSPTDATPTLVVDLDSNWIAINTDTPKPGYALSVDGRVVCEELLVENSTNWPDYVFEESYALRPLNELEAHIKEKKHLPGIPTAADIKKDGLPIGEMQKRMMEKIEELTLYVIDQNKKVTAQEERIRQLEAQLHSRETQP